MKIKVIISVLFIASLILTNTILSQPKEGTSMMPILNEAMTYIQEAENRSLEIVRIEFDIINDIKSSFRMLYEGWTYLIVAFGDYRISDLDIVVYKENNSTWEKIASDNSSKSNASVIIKPSSTSLYRIDIKVYKFVSGYNAAHYGLLIIHE